jgi:hypothetical protein
MFSLTLAKLLQFYLGRAFSHTDSGAIIAVLAIFALKPDMLSFTFLLGHYSLPIVS